jgi:hypothetical protein
MKTIFLMSLLISGNLFASTINLNLGDSITIQANTTTTVSCGNGENLCQLPVKNLKSKLDYCNTTNNSVEECLQQIWPPFKRSNPQCVNEGFNTCLNYCKTSSQDIDCLAICQ